MKSAGCVALAFMLAGCVTTAERQQQMTQAKDRCASGPSMFERIKCTNEAENRIYANGSPSALMQYKHAGYLQIAARVDRGEITKDQASPPRLQKTCVQSGIVVNCF